MGIRLRKTSNRVTVDDTNTDLVGGVADAALQQVLEAIDTRLDTADSDKRLAAIAPSGLPSPLPAANKGEYLLFNSSGTITVSGVDYQVAAGDRLQCTADDTAAGDETNWEFLKLTPTADGIKLTTATATALELDNVDDAIASSANRLDAIEPRIKPIVNQETIRFYLDLDNGNNNNSGSSSDPWRDFTPVRDYLASNIIFAETLRVSLAASTNSYGILDLEYYEDKRLIVSINGIAGASTISGADLKGNLSVSLSRVICNVISASDNILVSCSNSQGKQYIASRRSEIKITSPTIDAKFPISRPFQASSHSKIEGRGAINFINNTSAAASGQWYLAEDHSTIDFKQISSINIPTTGKRAVLTNGSHLIGAEPLLLGDSGTSETDKSSTDETTLDATGIELTPATSTSVGGENNVDDAIGELAKRDRPFYTRVKSGLAQTANGTNIDIAEGVISVFNGDLSNPEWEDVTIAAQSIPYPAGLSLQQPLFLFLSFTGVFSFGVNAALSNDLSDKLQLAEIRGDGTNITQVIPCYRDNNPKILAELNQSKGLVNLDELILEKPDTNVKEFKLRGGRILATGYSESGLIEKPAQATFTYDLIKSDGAIVAANQTEWNFTLFEDATGNVANLAGNDGAIHTVFLHPIDAKGYVLLGQGDYGNGNTALERQAGYNPVIPDRLKNNSYIPICKVIAEGNDSSSNVGSVNIVGIAGASSSGAAAIEPLTKGDILPLPTNANAIAHVLTNQGWRNGFYYQNESGRSVRVGSQWRNVDGSTPLADLTLIEGDRVFVSANNTTPVGGVALTLDLSEITTSHEIIIDSRDDSITATSQVIVDDGNNTDINYLDLMDDIFKVTQMPIAIAVSRQTIKLALVDGRWELTRN